MYPTEAILTDLESLHKWVAACLAEAPDTRIWLIDGNVGAGKTTTVQAFCQALGVTGDVASPTYSLAHTYASPKGPVHHLDLYRIDSMDEAHEAGLLDYIYGTDYCFVEWANNLPDLAPDSFLHLTLTLLPDGTRTAQVSTHYANA